MRKEDKTDGFHLKLAFSPIPRHEPGDKCTLVHDYISFMHIDEVLINKTKILPQLACHSISYDNLQKWSTWKSDLSLESNISLLMEHFNYASLPR